MQRPRILIAESDRAVARELHEPLACGAYRVEEVRSGEQALARCRNAGFDLVLAGFGVPDGGHALVRDLRALPSPPAVLVIADPADARAASACLKHGACQVLIAPVDGETLLGLVVSALEGSQLRREHARLLAENMEYLGVVSLHERSRRFFRVPRIRALAERICETLCVECKAGGAILWAAHAGEAGGLRRVAAAGSVRPAHEPEDLVSAPPWLRVESGDRSILAAPREGESEASALWLPLRHERQVLGWARLTDPADGEFSDRARRVAERVVEDAAVSVSNALRFADLERRSFRDPTTKAYTRSFLEDAVHNEIHRASRFGRGFSLVRMRLDPMGPLRTHMNREEFAAWLTQIVVDASRVLRSTDLIAAESEDSYGILLTETHGLGAAVLKRRLREALTRGECFRSLPKAKRPRILLGSASFPEDGGQRELLDAALEAGIARERSSLVHELGLADESFAVSIDALLERGRPLRTDSADQIVRFLLQEVARRHAEPGFCFLSPGSLLQPSIEAGLVQLARKERRTEVVLLADSGNSLPAGVTRVSPRRVGTRAPFAIYCGSGPSYALLCESGPEDGSAQVFHTDDRMLVEHLAFQLQRDLGVAVSA